MLKRWKNFWLALASLCLLLFPLWLIGETNALFTDQKDVPNNTISTATLTVSVSPSPVFTISNLIPGDTIQRTITIKNDGTVPFTYTIQASSNNTLLWTDKTNGLQLTIAKGATTYFSGPISDLNAASIPNTTLAPGASDPLDLTITFPVTANNTFQNLTDTITFTVQAMQLPGAVR
ncbi:MAG: M73 family metallopeptidase [Anoxybacillus sp.]|nr:TasA family protein [Anoxybacillus sp.]MCL6586037.1 M73 family metallopeptidase [Anoxybacillus sp.]